MTVLILGGVPRRYEGASRGQVEANEFVKGERDLVSRPFACRHTNASDDAAGGVDDFPL